MAGEGMAEGGCDCEDCRSGAGDGCDPAAGRGGHKHGCGLCAPLWCSDMWNEVHAHRRIYAQVDYLSLVVQGQSAAAAGHDQPDRHAASSSRTSAGKRHDGNPLRQRPCRLPTCATAAASTFGYWLIDGEFLGVEGQYFTLQQGEPRSTRVANFSGGDPNAIILARPFTNVDPIYPEPIKMPRSIAFPMDLSRSGNYGTGTLDGSIDIRTTSNLQSAGALLRRLIWIDFTMQRRLDLLLGYRFLRLDDSVTINDASTYIPTCRSRSPV